MRRKIGLALLALIALAVLAWLALATPPGRSLVAGIIERAAAASGLAVTIERPTGWLPFSFGAARIVVADGDGVFAEIDDLNLDIGVLALLTGAVVFDSATAARVNLARRPQLPAASGSGDGGPAVAARSIAVDRLELGAALAGRAAALTLTGQASLTGAGGIAAELTAERVDGRPGRLAAAISRSDAATAPTARLTLSEAADGILIGLLGRSNGPAYELTANVGPDSGRLIGKVTLASTGTARLDGDFSLSSGDGGNRLTIAARGDPGEFVPADYAALLAGPIDILIDAEAGKEDITVRQGRITTASVTAAMAGTLNRSTADLSLDLRVADPNGAAIALPMLPAGSQLTGATLSGRIAPADKAVRLDLAGQVTGLTIGAATLPGVGLAIAAEAAGDDPFAATTIPFGVRIEANAVATAQGRIDATETDPLLVTADGTFDRSAGTAGIDARLQAAGGSVRFAGLLGRDETSGTLTAAWRDVARLAALAGIELSGGAELSANGRFLGGDGLDLDTNATLTDLAPASPVAARLLADATRLTAAISWTEGGALAVSDFRAANRQIEASGKALLAGYLVEANLTGTVADVAVLSASGSGGATFDAEIGGTLPTPTVAAQLSVADGRILDKPLQNLAIDLDGGPAEGQWRGAFNLDGRFADAPLAGTANLVRDTASGRIAIPGIDLSLGDNRIEGGVEVLGAGLLAGRLSVTAPRLDQLAGLAALEAEGQFSGDIELAPDGDTQSLRLAFSANDVARGTVSAATANGTVAVADLFGELQIDGSVVARNAQLGEVRFATVEATATSDGTVTDYRIAASGDDIDGAATGSLSDDAGVTVLEVEALRGTVYGRSVALASPAAIRLGGGANEVATVQLSIGGGAVDIDIGAIEPLNVAVRAEDLPAGLANDFVPGLGADGRIDATAEITGSTAAPRIAWQASWSGAAVAASRNAGLPPLSISARGAADRTRTTLSGQLSQAGLELTFNGTVPYAGGGLEVTVNGRAPLSLLALRSNRELRLAGGADVSLTVTGQLAAPAISGSATLADATIVDGDTGFGLTGASGRIVFDGQRATLDGITGRLAQGGTATLSGSVVVTGQGLPADLSVRVSNGHYSDGRAVNASFDAELSVSGPLLGAGTLSGRVVLGRTELQLPDLPTGGTAALDVQHINTEPGFMTPRQEIGAGGAAGSGGSGGLNLAVELSAPQGILVRGFGVDAEFGGGLRIAGTTGSPQAVGAFTLNWGRLELLGRRFTIDTGTLTFSGDLVPFVQITASTPTSDAVVSINIAGRADNPTISFTSSPELPEEEVLARLLFNRSAGRLSPLQAIQLVDAVAQLTGVNGGGGLFTRVRNALGVDDLDVHQTESGGTAVGIGTRINERVRLGVEAGTGSADSRVSIDLDITDNLKARGEAGEHGSGKVGITFEREY